MGRHGYYHRSCWRHTEPSPGFGVQWSVPKECIDLSVGEDSADTAGKESDDHRSGNFEIQNCLTLVTIEVYNPNESQRASIKHCVLIALA